MYNKEEISYKIRLLINYLRHKFNINIFTEKDEDGISYQNKFNDEYSHDEAVAQLEKWIVADGYDKGGLNELRKIVAYPEITEKMNENRDIVENQLRVKGIPTMIYDGSRHTGLYKTEN